MGGKWRYLKSKGVRQYESIYVQRPGGGGGGGGDR